VEIDSKTTCLSYYFTLIVLTSFISGVTSWRVEPWRFQVNVGRGLPVARHSTVKESPTLARRGPAGVSRTLGESERNMVMLSFIV